MPSVRTRPDSLRLGVLLAAVGGFLDAYTYVNRGGVFANAQTANLVLLAIDAGRGRWEPALTHLLPLTAFGVGVWVAASLGGEGLRRLVGRPTRVALVAEVVTLGAVGFVSGSDRLVTAAVSFVSAVQISTFRSLRGVGYSTVMVTSDLRSLVEAVHDRLGSKPGSGARAAALVSVVVAFTAGAVAGGVTTHFLAARAVWIPAGMLVVVLAILVAETDALERRPPPSGAA